MAVQFANVEGEHRRDVDRSNRAKVTLENPRRVLASIGSIAPARCIGSLSVIVEPLGRGRAINHRFPRQLPPRDYTESIGNTPQKGDNEIQHLSLASLRNDRGQDPGRLCESAD